MSLSFYINWFYFVSSLFFNLQNDNLSCLIKIFISDLFYLCQAAMDGPKICGELVIIIYGPSALSTGCTILLKQEKLAPGISMPGSFSSFGNKNID